MARPTGRPLAEHVWQEGRWVYAITGEPFCQEVYEAGVRRRRADCERRRYWDLSTGTRERRLQRAKQVAIKRRRHASGAGARQSRARGQQLTLEQVRVGGAPSEPAWNEAEVCGDTAAPCCSGCTSA